MRRSTHGADPSPEPAVGWVAAGRVPLIRGVHGAVGRARWDRWPGRPILADGRGFPADPGAVLVVVGPGSGQPPSTNRCCLRPESGPGVFTAVRHSVQQVADAFQFSRTVTCSQNWRNLGMALMHVGVRVFKLKLGSSTLSRLTVPRRSRISRKGRLNPGIAVSLSTEGSG